MLELKRIRNPNEDEYGLARTYMDIQDMDPRMIEYVKNAVNDRTLLHTFLVRINGIEQVTFSESFIDDINQELIWVRLSN